MRVAWVLPSFIEGSGGHRTILQNIHYITKKGFTCDAYVEDTGEIKNEEDLRKRVFKFFGECDCNFFLGYDLKGDYDIIFATAWYTAKVVRDYPTKALKAYFIQDFEALFNPMGDGYLLACNSYCYGLSPITIGRWLSDKMKREYHTQSQYFDFCADKNVYKRLDKIQRENAVCFIYQPDKPRRCSLIGTEALGIVKYLRPETKIYLYGSNAKGNVWFEHENLGIISIEKCNELYNKCKVGLCISSSNPSRIPFEMMAAGLPVVDLHMENNLYDMPEEGVCLAHYTPESIAQAIIEILDDDKRIEEMALYGQKFMEKRTLEYGYEQFYQAVKHIIHGDIPENETVEKIYHKPPLIANVIMPNEIGNYREKESINNNGSVIERLKRVSFLRNSKVIRKIWKIIKR